MVKKGLPKIRIVCGTGRSGSWAWYRILQAQEGVEASHEGIPLPWEVDPCTYYYLMMRAMIAWQGRPIWVNSSFVWINYTGLLMKNFDDPRMVCIQRPKEQMVASFLKHWPEENFWTDPESPSWDGQFPKVGWSNPNPDELSLLWPKYDLPKREAIAAYYDDYCDKADFWRRRLPNNFMVIGLDEAMNTRGGQQRIFEFLGIEDPNYFVGVKLNQEGAHHGILYREGDDVLGTGRIYESPEIFGPETRVSLQPGHGEVCRDLQAGLWRADPPVSGGD